MDAEACIWSLRSSILTGAPVSLRDVPHPDHDTEEFGRRGFLGSAVGTAAGATLLGGLTAGPASAASRATADHPVRTRSGLVTGVPAALDGITV